MAELVSQGRKLNLKKILTKPYPKPDESATRQKLWELCASISEHQERLYAGHQQRLLVVFQGMDTSGKDSTTKNVFSQCNPAGIKVTSFKKPSSKELDHDFLW